MGSGELEKTREIEQIIDDMILLALRYEKSTNGRKIGITGEVGEVKTCKLLSLKLAPFMEKGYDGIAPDNTRYQIKTRRKMEPPESGKVPAFKNEDFEIAVLTMLNEEYMVDSISMLPKNELLQFLSGDLTKPITIGNFQKLCKEKGSMKNFDNGKQQAQ